MSNKFVAAFATPAAAPIAALVMLFSGCSDRGQPATADSAASTPAAPSYIVSDTMPYDNLISEGRMALLRRGDEFIDTVDVAFGVHIVGRDSVLFLPVRSDSDGTGGISTMIDEHVLFDGTKRILLKDIVPNFHSGFSSPSILDGALYYWGVYQKNGADSVQAVRYEFKRRRLNQILLPEATIAGTDDRFYFTPPFLEGKEYVFKSPAREWRFRTPKQR